MTGPLDLEKLEPVLEKYYGQDGALIPILQETQEIYGYLPEGVLAYITQKLKIPLSKVYGVVTFYAQFYLTPRGVTQYVSAGELHATCVEERMYASR